MIKEINYSTSPNFIQQLEDKFNYHENYDLMLLNIYCHLLNILKFIVAIR